MGNPRHRIVSLRPLAAVALLTCCGSTASAITSTGTAPFPFGGLDINTLVGANTFYNAGYTGTRATVAVLDGGHIWSNHESLGHVTTLISAAGTYPQLGDIDRHATWIGHAVGGRGEQSYQRGIAHGADLWSAALGTEWFDEAYSISFGMSYDSFSYPFIATMRDGVNGRTADVLNISWGGGSWVADSFFPFRIDAIIQDTGKTVVIAGGNSGGLTTAPACGYNGIAVAPLMRDSGAVPYNAPASFGSHGPNPYYNPLTKEYIFGARATIAIAAPGDHLTLALYSGVSGGNIDGTDPLPGVTNQYTSDNEGTSYAAPIVAGGAALLADVGHDRFDGGRSIDARVIKSVLQNSADKTAGWTNNQRHVGGVLTTTRSLDYNVGAGAMNLDRAFTQYTAGTTDIPGDDAGRVQPVGWDFGKVGSAAPSDYFITTPLTAGAYMTVTLNWFVDNQWTPEGDQIDYGTFDNLDLQVWRGSAGQPGTLIAQSTSLYNTTEHLAFLLPTAGQYFIRVLWAGTNYDYLNAADEQFFGLAWSVTIPTPGAGLLAVTAVLTAAVRRRRPS